MNRASILLATALLAGTANADGFGIAFIADLPGIEHWSDWGVAGP